MNRSVAIAKVMNYDASSIESGLRTLFQLLGINPDNPFSEVIKPGMRVFIKPNWVASRWRESCPYKGDIYSVITHPSLMEAVADKVALALQGSGEIMIGDNPSVDADFEELMQLTSIRKLESKYDVPCRVIDMRPLICTDLQHYGKLGEMQKVAGDPGGDVRINLGRQSLFYHVEPSLFRGVFDEREDTIASHTGENQIYTYGRSLYDADYFISLPKMKTHQKVGVTLNLKGLVGTITEKNQLVHWRVGTPEDGGDEYPSRQAMENAKREKVTHRGAWPGNDTIWRMVVDLYHGMKKRERGYFTIVDGIMAGEGQGPFCPRGKAAQTLVASEDLLTCDLATTRLMGIDPKKIKYLSYIMDEECVDLKAISVLSADDRYTNMFNTNDRLLDFDVVEAWRSVKV